MPDAAVPTTVQPLNYRIPDAAKRLGVGQTTIYRLMKIGALETVKLGNRTLIPVAEVDRLQARLLAGELSKVPLSRAAGY